MKAIEYILVLICSFTYAVLPAQGYWQQRVEYTMEVDMDVTTHRFTGIQKLLYFNNSPDTLSRVFYHMYFNAFHKGSAMDIRSQQLPDPDRRIQRMQALQPGDEGYLKTTRLTQDGTEVTFSAQETILEVQLARPLYPGTTTQLDMQFHGQVPKQIRRSGRDNAEGIVYSMAQWYPKLCAYDVDGWHPNPYVSREFYGEFGSFDVTIHIDQKYMVAATGTLQNANTLGFGYTDVEVKPSADVNGRLTWHFIANDVHDFAWAADPDYTHVHLTRADGTVLRFFYQQGDATTTWNELPRIMDKALDYMNTHFGRYPYPCYSFIQGGDGGMEYPMATLMSGNRPLVGLVSTAIHELMHAWYHGVISTNESLYAWMDEGFANHTGSRVMQYLESEGVLPPESISSNPYLGDYLNYLRIVELGIEEPMSMHADHFATNSAYSVASYSKGDVMLAQLEYIIGPEALDRTFLKYFETWQFRHPRPQDFMRIAEKESGMILDWYYEYWVLSTRTIDYALAEMVDAGRDTKLTLQRVGQMPMPIEVKVVDKKGREYWYYIPLDLMRGARPFPAEPDVTGLEDWRWVDLTYDVILPCRKSQIATVEIDPSGRMADIDRANNVFDADGDR